MSGKMPLEFIEFTLALACPVQCRKYCPQEVFIRAYKGKRWLMTMGTFEKCVGHLPFGLPISFAGFCEPFANPDFLDIAEYAARKGHPLYLYSTLHGASSDDVRRLCSILWKGICLHLPDGVNCNFPFDDVYRENVFKVLRCNRNVWFSVMNDLFVSCGREDVCRGKSLKRTERGACIKLVAPEFVVLPDGSVTLCCMDFGLKHSVGNLRKEHYETMRQRFLDGLPRELCHYCLQYKLGGSPL